MARRPISAIMYSHDGVGLGHLRRNLNIASRLVREDLDANVLMIVGCPSGILFEFPTGVDYVKLPSVAKVATNTWNSSRLRISQEQARDLRSKLILRVVELFKPNLFLTDHLPAGVWGELLPTLRVLRSSPLAPKVVLGLRDILDCAETVRRTWYWEGTYDVIDRYYDSILVYGRQDIFDTAGEYGLDRLAPGKIRYCGYLGSEDPVLGRDAARAMLRLGPGRLIVISAGGGADAYPMIAACVAALRTFDPGQCPNAIIVTGALMDPSQRAEIEHCGEGLPVRVLGHVPDVQNHISAADLAITMGGYNTLVECIRLGKPTIVVPRANPSAEQTTRARVFSDLGLITTVELSEATPERLAQAIRKNLVTPRLPYVSLGSNGVTAVVRHLLGGLAQRSPGLSDQVLPALEAL